MSRNVIPVFDIHKHRKLASVLYNHSTREDDELTLKVGDVVEIISRDRTITGAEGWWLGKIKDKKMYGLFPSNYVVLHQDHI